MNLIKHTIFAAAALAVAVPATATTAGAVTTIDPVTSMPVPRDDDDRDFPWGLLGLLGLAGLLGRKKHDDVRVDRNDNVRH